jgi:hypothetical protein
MREICHINVQALYRCASEMETLCQQMSDLLRMGKQLAIERQPLPLFTPLPLQRGRKLRRVGK